MQIAPFDPSDFKDAVRLLSFCIGKHAENELREYIQNPGVSIFCARDRNMCGIILLMISFDSCDILDIAVDTDMRRRGVASALLAHASVFCRERGVLQQLLEVRLSNAGARAFYERAGFKEIARRRGYYSNPTEDASVMRREI